MLGSTGLCAMVAFGPGRQREPVMPDTHSLLMKIQALSPERQSEVEDFVDFLSAKSRRQAALNSLLSMAPAMEAAGAPPLSEEDIQAEVDAVRSARHGRGSGAHRS